MSRIRRDDVSDADRRAFDRLVGRRATGEPIPFIKGSTEFRGLDLLVRPGVFVPRDSSENLADPSDPAAPRAAPAGARGSGDRGRDDRARGRERGAQGDRGGDRCVRRRGRARQEEREATGSAGAVRHRRPVRRAPSARSPAPWTSSRCILRTCPMHELKDLPEEIREWEPEHTLTDRSRDGLGLIGRTAREAPAWLSPNGWLLMEVSPDRVALVKRVLGREGFRDMRSTKGGPIPLTQGDRREAPGVSQVAPYGTWRSPISAEMVAVGGVTLSQPRLDDGSVYWQESRPSEGGRSVLMHAAPFSETGRGHPARVQRPDDRSRIRRGRLPDPPRHGVLLQLRRSAALPTGGGRRSGGDHRRVRRPRPVRGRTYHARRTMADLRSGAPPRSRRPFRRDERARRDPARWIRGAADRSARAATSTPHPGSPPMARCSAGSSGISPGCPGTGARSSSANSLMTPPSGTCGRSPAGRARSRSSSPRGARPATCTSSRTGPAGGTSTGSATARWRRSILPRRSSAGPNGCSGCRAYGFLGDGRIACLWERDGVQHVALLDPESGELIDLDVPHSAMRPTLDVEGDRVAFVGGGPSIPDRGGPPGCHCPLDGRASNVVIGRTSTKTTSRSLARSSSRPRTA